MNKVHKYRQHGLTTIPVLRESERFFFFNFEHVHLKSRHFFIYLFYCYNSGEDPDCADNMVCLLRCLRKACLFLYFKSIFKNI